MTNMIMLDKFLFVHKTQITAIQICDNNPHILVYAVGTQKPFRIKCDVTSVKEKFYDLYKQINPLFENNPADPPHIQCMDLQLKLMSEKRKHESKKAEKTS